MPKPAPWPSPRQPPDRPGELEQLALSVAHELKAPLRGIDHLARWIEEDLGGRLAGTASGEHLGLLRRRVRRLGRLVDDLVAYARIGHHGQPPALVELGPLVQDTIELLGPPPGFVFALDAALPPLWLARTPLEIVLRNLLSNALKHHDRASGRIEVAARVEGAALALRIADDGPGIPRQDLELVFQMFKTLRPRDQVEGSGLGLTIVRRILDVHGGTIALGAPARGRGTEVRLRWPLGEPRQGG
jgi:signal transduction histidine kinase